jgi:uncharacterized damage-inducible protein DinB
MPEIVSVRTTILSELENEEPATRRMLERVPADRWDWQPHPRSMAMGRLAACVLDFVWMVPQILATERFDLSAPPETDLPKPTIGRAAELAPAVAPLYQAARQAVEAADPAAFAEPWSFLWGGRVQDTHPRHVAIRGTLNHLVHHRAQLSVYLRLCEAPVPGIYGPSADEPWNG